MGYATQPQRISLKPAFLGCLVSSHHQSGYVYPSEYGSLSRRRNEWWWDEWDNEI